MPEVQSTERIEHAVEKGSFKDVLATVEAAVEADVDALLEPGPVDAKDFEGLVRAVRRQALATADRVAKAAGRPRSRPRSRPTSTRSSDRAGRRAGFRGHRAGRPSSDPRHRVPRGGAAPERGPCRPFGADGRVRLRTAGALRRPPPEDVHHGAGAADAGTRLLHTAPPAVGEAVRATGPWVCKPPRCRPPPRGW